jgi:predicted nucleotidyltransferase
MFQSLLVNLAKQFDRNSIPYMVIGGQAVLVYGEPRLTRDIDITLGVDNSEYEKIFSICSIIGLKSAVENVSQFVQKSNVLPLYDDTTHIRVDLIFSYMPYERQAMKRVKRILINEYEVKYASMEDVIIHKIFAGRSRDIEDVKSILNKNSQYDRMYIVDWLKSFSQSLGTDFIRKFEDVELP